MKKKTILDKKEKRKKNKNKNKNKKHVGKTNAKFSISSILKK
jgi:hypothetical protein